MKSIEEIADKYIREQYIDYGDLNDQAEIQIRDAVIFGLKQGQKLPIHNVVGSNVCKSCGIDLSKEECINCQMGFG